MSPGTERFGFHLFIDLFLSSSPMHPYWIYTCIFRFFFIFSFLSLEWIGGKYEQPLLWLRSINRSCFFSSVCFDCASNIHLGASGGQAICDFSEGFSLLWSVRIFPSATRSIFDDERRESFLPVQQGGCLRWETSDRITQMPSNRAVCDNLRYWAFI